MPDHIAAVRVQAEKEAERIWPKYPNGEAARIMDPECWVKRKAYVRGQADLASRLTREKIAIALAKRKARDWDSMSGALHVAAIHAEYPNADAVLALLVDDTQR